MIAFRCIRPNAENRASYFDAGKVLTQLRYTGVMETVKIRHMGYSYRPTFVDFISRFRLSSVIAIYRRLKYMFSSIFDLRIII